MFFHAWSKDGASINRSSGIVLLAHGTALYQPRHEDSHGINLVMVEPTDDGLLEDLAKEHSSRRIGSHVGRA
jgi:hypothetical protein